MKIGEGWSSFIPTLLKAVENTEGPILELGSGLFSTPLLHWICKEKNRTLVTYENSKDYYPIARKFRTESHHVTAIFDENWISQIQWSVVLVDHGTNKKNCHVRGSDTLRLKNCAQYLILHDTQKRDDDCYGYDKIWPEFKYIYHASVSPRTSVVSNISDLKLFK